MKIPSAWYKHFCVTLVDVHEEITIHLCWTLLGTLGHSRALLGTLWLLGTLGLFWALLDHFGMMIFSEYYKHFSHDIGRRGSGNHYSSRLDTLGHSSALVCSFPLFWALLV